VPDDYETNDPDVLYGLMKEKYERDYKMAFIDTTNNISYEINGVVHYFSKTDMVFKLDDVRIKDDTFFPRWSEDSTKQRFVERGRGHVLSWVGLGEQPCYLARFRGSSASCRAAIPHAKAVTNWSSASSVKFAAKSTASHYFAVLLRCSLAVGLNLLGQAARVV
jgi:hypothetical protein